MLYFTYFGGGHLGFCSLAELAHIFTRWYIAYFFKNLFLNQNQSSKIESEKVVTDSIGFASTMYTSVTRWPFTRNGMLVLETSLMKLMVAQHFCLGEQSSPALEYFVKRFKQNHIKSYIYTYIRNVNTMHDHGSLKDMHFQRSVNRE